MRAQVLIKGQILWLYNLMYFNIFLNVNMSVVHNTYCAYCNIKRYERAHIHIVLMMLPMFFDHLLHSLLHRIINYTYACFYEINFLFIQKELNR